MTLHFENSDRMSIFWFGPPPPMIRFAIKPKLPNPLLEVNTDPAKPFPMDYEDWRLVGVTGEDATYERIGVVTRAALEKRNVERFKEIVDRDAVERLIESTRRPK